MYLSLGGNGVIPSAEIIGIFDLDNTTVSKNTRRFLEESEKQGRVITLGESLPQSFIVRQDKTVYLSPVVSKTLARRKDMEL